MICRRRGTPRYFVCQRKACGKVKRIPKNEQRRRKFCSHRCAALEHRTIAGQGAKGGRISAQRRRQRILKQIAGLSRLEVFHKAYRIGLNSKCHQLRKKYIFVKREGSRPCQPS
jgi:hypothetical protein